jgi:hypothetical protein
MVRKLSLEDSLSLGTKLIKAQNNILNDLSIRVDELLECVKGATTRNNLEQVVKAIEALSQYQVTLAQHSLEAVALLKVDTTSKQEPPKH